MAQIKTKMELLDSLRDSIEHSKQTRDAIQKAAGKIEPVADIEIIATGEEEI